jgi:hypothetical protein
MMCQSSRRAPSSSAAKPSGSTRWRFPQSNVPENNTTIIVLPDGSAADVDEVFRGEARYAGEQPRRFEDLSDQPLIGSVEQRPAPPPPVKNQAFTRTEDTGHPRGAGALMNWIETMERRAAEPARAAQNTAA